jgi:Putative Actinobacterial Holin-X, holin superfamily III
VTPPSPSESVRGAGTDVVGPPVSVDGVASVGSLIGDVASDVTRLLRQEVELARAEIRGAASKAAKAGQLFAGGAMALHLVAVLASVAVGLVAGRMLADRRPEWAEFAPAVTTAGLALLWLVIGLVLLWRGRRRLRSISLVPRQTINTIKEDIAWLRKSTG